MFSSSLCPQIFLPQPTVKIKFTPLLATALTSTLGQKLGLAITCLLGFRSYYKWTLRGPGLCGFHLQSSAWHTRGSVTKWGNSRLNTSKRIKSRRHFVNQKVQQRWKALLLFVYFIYLFIWLCGFFDLHCGTWDLVPWPGIELGPPPLEAWSLSHWIIREVPGWKTLLPLFNKTERSRKSSNFTSVWMSILMFPKTEPMTPFWGLSQEAGFDIFSQDSLWKLQFRHLSPFKRGVGHLHPVDPDSDSPQCLDH